MQYLESVFSGFSVDDIEAARSFYADKLGLACTNHAAGSQLALPDGGQVFIYAKPDHHPAEFTILNFVVTDIDATVTELSGIGIKFLTYDNLGHGIKQDEHAILRGKAAGMGPDIAWFNDPAGNILSVMQQT